MLVQIQIESKNFLLSFFDIYFSVGCYCNTTSQLRKKLKRSFACFLYSFKKHLLSSRRQEIIDLKVAEPRI